MAKEVIKSEHQGLMQTIQASLSPSIRPSTQALQPNLTQIVLPVPVDCTQIASTAKFSPAHVQTASRTDLIYSWICIICMFQKTVGNERQPLHANLPGVPEGQVKDLVDFPASSRAFANQSKGRKTAPDPAGGQRVTNTEPANRNKVRAGEKAKLEVQNPLANLDSLFAVLRADYCQHHRG